MNCRFFLTHADASLKTTLKLPAIEKNLLLIVCLLFSIVSGFSESNHQINDDTNSEEKSLPADALDKVTTPNSNNAPNCKFSINHVNQGNGAYCGSASIMMALQYQTGLSFEGHFLKKVLAGLDSHKCYKGQRGISSFEMLRMLNVSNTELAYNTEKLKTSAQKKSFISEKLEEDIIPALESGKIAILSVTSDRGLSHSVVAYRYDKHSRSFIIHDPLNNEKEQWDYTKFVNQWQVYVRGKLHVRAQLISQNNNVNKDSPIRIPKNKKISLDKESLSSVFFQQALSTINTKSKLPKQTYQEIVNKGKMVRLDKFWEKDRNHDVIRGVSMWLKVKVAIDEPACLFYRKDNGETDLVAVTGYSKGVNNFEGPIQISYLKDGVIENKWMSCKELQSRTKITGADSNPQTYIIYPETSLVRKHVKPLEN